MRSVRWSGPVLAAGGIALGLAIVLVALRPVGPDALTPEIADLFVVATALLLVALPGLHAIQSEQAGAIGLVGNGLLTVGLLLLVLVSAAPILYPTLGLAPTEHPMLFFLALALTAGLLLTGIATWRAAVLPRPAAGLLLAGMVGFFFAFYIAELLAPPAGQIGSAACGILLGAAFAWLGVAMWRAPKAVGGPSR